MDTPTVTPREAAKILGVSGATIYRWIKRGWINYIKLPNGYIRLSKSVMEELADKGVEELSKDFAESAKW